MRTTCANSPRCPFARRAFHAPHPPARVGLVQDGRVRRNVAARVVQHEEVVYGINEQVRGAFMISALS